MPNEFAQNAEYGGLVSGVANNHADVRNMESYNTFDRSQTIAQTQRFAEINPIFCNKFNDGDIVPLQSDHELRTFTLDSPLLSPLYMHRSFYSVPLKCIYPKTFEVFYKPQIKGADFPAAATPKFNLGRVADLINYIKTTDGSEANNSQIIWLNNLFLLLQIMSQDGLLVKLGFGFKNFHFDEITNTLLNHVGVTIQWTRNSDNTAMSMDFGDTSIDLSVRRFHLFRLINNKYTITGVTPAPASGNAWYQLATILRGLECFNRTYYFTNEYITLEKVIAYQLVCAQFFTNSYVDDINTAKKWLENQYSLIMSLSSSYITQSQRTFVLNGVRYEYDLISNQLLNAIFGLLINTQVPAAQKLIPAAVLRNIFEVHESLKTSDYFTDARTQPLAVGDVYSAVVNNQVSAIDINHKLWLQRFLNAVNRIPDNINEYLRSIFGEDPIAKEPQPMFISSERFAIGKQEVENTANNQGNTVTLLRTEDSRYRFEFKLKDPSIVIGLNSYSIDYCYASAADRAFYETDRYENFNPYLQHIGDQPIWRKELVNDFTANQSTVTFGYQMRFAQYKTNINHCSGAFSDDELPSWLAIWDKTDAFNYPSLNSDFIRNMNIDFDAFYSSLTGKKLTSYFHFICTFHTSCYVNSKQQKFPSLT